MSSTDEVKAHRRRRDEAFKDAVDAFAALQSAKADYDEMLMRAHILGVPNARLANAFGQTETAVRSYIKRRLEKK